MKELIRDIGKKKLLTILGIIVGIIVIIIVSLLIYNSLFKKDSYKDIENKVLSAAKKYYKDNSNLLPQNETEEVSTTDTNLTAAGYLKSMTELTKGKKTSCTATITVTYKNGDYRYTPILNCGSDYKTVLLSNYIQENEKTVYTGQGLYELNGELVYRGDNPNNYVKFADKNWRIVKIVDNRVVLILEEKESSVAWDDRYNSDRNSKDGINNYDVSRISEHLTDLYTGDNFFKKNTKNNLSLHSVYIGKRSKTEFYNDGSIEKATVYENKYIGLLPLYDYINASLDENCKSADTNSCANYNYLNNFKNNWWTATGDSSTSHKVYKITMSGTIDISRASGNGYVRPVVYLAKDILYVAGDGTNDKPYQVK